GAVERRARYDTARTRPAIESGAGGTPGRRPGADRGARGAARAHRCLSAARHRGQEKPFPRRPAPGTAPGESERFRHHRLRGRDSAPAVRAPAEALAAEGRGRYGTLALLRG